MNHIKEEFTVFSNFVFHAMLELFAVLFGVYCSSSKSLELNKDVEKPRCFDAPK